MRELKFFLLGMLAAIVGTVLAQTQILDLDVIGQLEVQGVGAAATPSIQATSTLPMTELEETDASADSGIWQTFANADVLTHRTLNDARAASADYMRVNRTGITIDNILLDTPTLRQTGNGFSLFTLNDSAAAADEGRWRLISDAGVFSIQTELDSGSASQTLMTSDRTGGTIDSFDILSIDMVPETGTFEVTWETACTTTPTQTWNYARIGNVVTIRMVDNVSCTSDSTGFASTDADWPASLRPAGTITITGFRVFDNGVADADQGCFQITAAGIPSMERSVGSPCSATAWTASGTKSISPNGINTFGYTLQ